MAIKLTTSKRYNTKTVLIECESVQDIVDTIDNLPMAKAWRGDNDYKNGCASYFYGATWADTKDLITHGWPEGAAQINHAIGANGQGTGQARAQESYLDVAGAFPSVPDACAGAIESMVNFQEGRVIPKRIIKIMVNISMSSDYEPKHFLNRGAAIVGLIDNLENQGHRVELWLCRASAINGESITLCPLKDASQPVDLDRLAFWFMNPAALRRAMFSFTQRFNETDFLEGSMGAGMRIIPDDIRGDAVYIPPGNSQHDDYSTPDKAAETIKGLIKNQLDILA